MAARSTRRASGPLAAAAGALRAHALAKPEASEHFPWGETAIKVKGKVFLFMHSDATSLSLSTKLPQSGGVALMLPFATPTGYGLGKAGWVSARFAAGDVPPVDMLCAWIDESYQAVAPAKLAAAARADGAAAAAAPAANARRAAARSAAPARRATAKRVAPAKRATAKPAAPAKRATAKPAAAAKRATARPVAPARATRRP
jgi:predicted DNA-binding protein (MmcQ/YjbR family)